MQRYARIASYLVWGVTALFGIGGLIGGSITAGSGVMRTELAEVAEGMAGFLLGGALTAIAYFTWPASLRRQQW